MVGFLLEDDARTARKNAFQQWLDEQQQNAERAAQTVSSAATQISDEALRRRQELEAWVASQAAAQPVQAQPTPQAVYPVQNEIGPPATPEAQQRASAFQDWLSQRQQDVQGAAQAVQGAIAPVPETQVPSQSPAEEPRAPTGPVVPVNDKWNTSFDFGQTYTGNYRTGTPHRGIDLTPRGGGGIGTPVEAFAPGKVTNISRDNGAGGLMVYVQDEQGLTHAYMHLQGAAPGLKVGDQVQRGQHIAFMGESGTEGSPHLHYEVRKNAATGDPLDQLIDPRPYLRGEGVSQPTVAGAPSAGPAARTTAELSGGGPAGGMTERAQGILSGAADIVRPFGEDAVKAVQAVLVTEGGLNNARGDQGHSAGPLQFYGGVPGRPGQLDNFARAFGMGVDAAKQWVEQNPLQAIQWAIGTPDNPGYLGRALQAAQAAGARGADLATYIQRYGQVSVSPERAGQNFQNLFGQGQAAVTGAAQAGLDTLGRTSADVASRAEQLARDSTRLAQESADRAQSALDLLNQTRQGAMAENERWLEQRRADADRIRADIMAPRQFDLSMAQNMVQPMLPGGGPPGTPGGLDGGFRAPDLSRIGQPLEDLGRAVGPLFQEDPYIQQQRQLAQTPEGRRQQIAAAAGTTPELVDLGVPGAIGTGAMIRSQQALLEQEADIRAGERVADTVIQKAKDAGWQPDETSERIARTALSQLTPMNVLMTVALAPGGLTARTLATEAALLGASVLGQTVGLEATRGQPELQPFAGLAGAFVAPVAGMAALGGARAAARQPAVREFLRSERGELNLGGAPPPPEGPPQRMYHGTGAEFERPSVFSEESMYGPGYYLTDEPRVAGGVVSRGTEELVPGGARRPPGQIMQRGYAQEAMPPGFDERALARDEQMAQSRLNAAQRDLEYATQNRNPVQETEALRHIERAQRDLDEIAADRAASFNVPAGPNVRAVEVPPGMRLLDAENYTNPQDIQTIRRTVVDAIGDASVFDRQIARAFEGRPTGKQVYEALTAEFGRTSGAYATANRVLADAGFDGIRYPGGQVMPIVDEAGRELRHNAMVIFSESIDRLRNAISGTQGGAVNPMFAARLGTGTAAGAAGYATAPEGATQEERLARAALFGAAGLGAPFPLRAAARSPGGVRQFLRGERGEMNLLPEELTPAQLARAADEDLAVEKTFSGPIGQRLQDIGQQPVTQAEIDDAARTLAGLRARGDRITGVPAQFATPEGLAQLRARLRVFAEEGASQKDWYSDSSRSIKAVTQGNLKDAERLAQLVAIYSPNTPVDTNMNNALQAWFQWKAGEPIRVAMGAQDERARALLYDGVQWEGRKTNNFYRNLMQHIDRAVYEQLGKETGQSGVTADIWMMRAFDYLAGANREGRRWLKSPSPAQYDFIQDEIARLGKEFDWTPEQTQASVWSSVKAAAEGTGISEAGFHYGSALERRMAQVSYTASPGSAEMQRVPGYMEAPEPQRAAYNMASESGFLDPVTGRDQLAEAMGIYRGRTIEAPEVYGEYVGPGLQAEVPVPAAKTSRTEKVLDPLTGELVTRSVPLREAFGRVFAPARAALSAYAAARGIILKQDAVPWTRTFWTNVPLRDSNVVELHIGRPLTSAEAAAVNASLTQSLGEGAHAVVATDRGAWILNLQGGFERNPQAPRRVIDYTRREPMIGPLAEGQVRRPGVTVPATREENIVGTWVPQVDEAGNPQPFRKNEDFWKQVKDSIAEVDWERETDANLAPARADGEYVWNDWTTDAQGQNYRSLIESGGRTQSFATVEAPITRRVRQAQADVAARFGWPADPTNPFSRTGGAEPGAAAARERALPGAPELESGVGPRAPPAEGAGFTAPPGGLGDILTARQEAAADPRLALRLGGAVAGGVAGYKKSEEDEEPLARYANIAGGALVGAFLPGFAIGALRRGRVTGQELEALRPRTYAPTGQAQAPTVGGAISSYGRGNLLSTITGHLANIASQAVELGRQPTLRAVAGYEDEAGAGVRGMADMQPEALKRFIDVWRTGRSIYATEPGTTSNPVLKMIMSIDDYFRTVGEGMGRSMAARRALNEAGDPKNPAQIRQVLQSKTDDIVKEGDKASALTVFGEGHGGTGLGPWISEQKHKLLGSKRWDHQVYGLLLDWLVPFSNVPDRLWTAGVSRSPGVNEVGQFAKAGYHIAKGDSRAARMALAEMAVGSVINSAVISHLMAGNITGPDDPEHPNSINLGGTWYDYSGWGPYALPIALPAAIAESMRKTGNKPDAQTIDYAKAVSSASVKALMNQMYLGSFLRLAGQIERGDVGGVLGTAGLGYIDRLIPASGLLNQVEQMTDQTMRDTDPMRPWERQASRIPGLSNFLPKTISGTTGEPQLRARGGEGAGGILGPLLRAEMTQSDPVKAKLAELDRRGYDVSLYKDYPDTVSWNGAEIRLRPDEQRAITAQLGSQRAGLAEFVSSPGFAAMSEDQQALLLRRRLQQIDERKTAVFLSVADQTDLMDRVKAGRRVAGRLEVGAGR